MDLLFPSCLGAVKVDSRKMQILEEPAEQGQHFMARAPEIQLLG